MDAIKYDDFKYYTYNDYKDWEGAWELIDGVAYAMSPAPYPKHQKIVFKLAKELDNSLNCKNRECAVYISPVDWKISENTVVQPDVSIFCEDDNRQYFTLTPLLVVEVLSKATALKDVTTKFKLYEKEGVEFYIIVEPNGETANIFKLVKGSYQLLKKVNAKDSFEFNLKDCKSVIDFAKVFK